MVPGQFLLEVSYAGDMASGGQVCFLMSRAFVQSVSLSYALYMDAFSIKFPEG